MISFNGLLLCICFLILTIGFIDFFVKIPYENRCEMTYMYQPPEYVPIHLTTKAKKDFPDYNLFVYGEGEYADSLRLKEMNGNPVLFVPGNGGSYKQVRSLASVSLVMSYSTRASHFNYFTIDYNEELSAFIGSKLKLQTEFLYYSIRKIVQLYNHVPDIKIILIGHSIGGILIKALFTQPYFKPYLANIAVVFTLASPHSYPAIPFDMNINEFYYTARMFNQDRQLSYGHINFVSIGGSSNDKLIRSDLVLLESSYQFDRSILTTSIDDVWASADHLCIVWCRQLVIKLNQIIFDLVENEFIVASSERRQEIIDFHLMKRYFMGPYPNYRISAQTTYPNKTEWVEHSTRLVRFNMTKLINSACHLIPLLERETIVLHIEGLFKANTLSVCQVAQIGDKLRCSSDGLNIHEHVRLVPTRSKNDRHVAQLDAKAFLDMGFTHLVLTLTPSQSSYSVLIDRFTTMIRQKSISLPSLWSIIFKGAFFRSTVVFSKLISQEQSFFNLTLLDFDSVWQSYYLQMRTKSCYTAVATFLGYSHLSVYPAQLSEYYWPFMPSKGSNFQFTLRLNRPIGPSKGKASLLLHLEPNCGYELSVKFSIIESSAQFVKHYFTLLVPMIVSTAMLVVSVQLSNVLLLYSYSNKQLHQLESIKNNLAQHMLHSKLVNKKCLVFLTTSQVMVNWRYFIYSFAQINLFTIISVFTIKRFYPWHDIAYLANLPLSSLFGVSALLFMFAYSLVYVFTNVVRFMADNFAVGVNFAYLRLRTLSINWPLEGFISVTDFNLLFAYLAAVLLITGYFLFASSVFYLVHMCFTILMLLRFIQLNNVELKVGRTTSTSFVRAFFPVFYALQFVLLVLQVPQSIDSLRSLGSQSFSLSQIWLAILAPSQLTIYALVCIVLYLYIHSRPLKLDSRLSTLTSQRSQNWLSLALILFAFCNILVGALAFEFINYSVLATLSVISRATSVLYKQIKASEQAKLD